MKFNGVMSKIYNIFGIHITGRPLHIELKILCFLQLFQAKIPDFSPIIEKDFWDAKEKTTVGKIALSDLLYTRRLQISVTIIYLKMFSVERQIKLKVFNFFLTFEKNPWLFQVRRNFMKFPGFIGFQVVPLYITIQYGFQFPTCQMAFLSCSCII